MEQLDFSTIELRSYLLGTLSRDREEAIDLAILSGGELDDRIAVVEGLIIEDYLRGELVGSELYAFKESFLSSRSRSEKIAQIRDLMFLSSEIEHAKRPSEDRVAIDRSSPSLFSWFRSLAFATVLLLLAGVIGIWFVRSRPVQPQMDPEIARLNAKGIRETDVPDVAARINVTQGLTRATSSLPEVSASVRNVLISMALPPSVDAKGTLTAEISADSQPIQTVKLSKPQMLKDDGIVRMLLPGNFLKPGQYQIELANDDGKMLAKYYFNVTD